MHFQKLTWQLNSVHESRCIYIYIVPIEHWIFSSAMLVYQMVWSERDVAMTKVIACFLEHDESFKL